jgi:alkylation response protein AidB-like acyl-CoA dehydrogenase
MYSLELSPEQIEIRDTIRDLVAREIKPFAQQSARLEALDRRLPLQLLDQASQMGLRALALSEASGGVGLDNLTCCIVTEELATGDPDIAAVLSHTATLAHVLFDQSMSTEQRSRFLPLFLAEDRHHLAFAELEADSDPALGVNYHRPETSEAALKTIAARDGDAWIVNGTKTCVPNAPIAGLFVVEAQTPGTPGPSTLLVPAKSAGLAVKEPDQETRWYHGACGDVSFENVRVPAESLLGPEGGSSLRSAVARLVTPQLAALNLGIGRAAYEAALDYAQLRVQGGRRIIEHQAIGVKLADVAIKLEVARAMIWQAAWAADHPEAQASRSVSDLPLATMAQAFAAETIYACTKQAVECFGAMAVMRDMPLQKHVHDALICLHAGTGNSDAKLRIAEALAGHRRPTAMLAAE